MVSRSDVKVRRKEMEEVNGTPRTQVQEPSRIRLPEQNRFERSVSHGEVADSAPVRTRVALIRDGVLRAAKIEPDVAGEDTLRINMRQNTIIMSTPSLANAKNYSNIKEIQVNGKSYATAAYITAPENTSKGVIHGIPTYDNQEDIEKSLVNQRNPTILHARRMGLTDSVVIVFEGSFVPYFVYYRGAEYRCLLYKKQYETCTTCGRVGHRADVCPQPDSKKCRGCGVLDPTDDHQCDPQCYLCGKGHLTGDKKCKERFKTPYLLKKRMWEKQQRQRDEQQEMNVSTNTSTTQNWKEHTAENPTEENGNATQDKGGRLRDRSSSFPRLAEGERETTQRRLRSRSRSRSAPHRSRSRARSKSSTKPSPQAESGVGPDGGRGNRTTVSWAGKLSGESLPSGSSSEAVVEESALGQELNQIKKMLEQLTRENAKQRDEIKQLKEENAKLRRNQLRESPSPIQSSTQIITHVSAQASGAHAAKRRAEEISHVESEDISKLLEKKVENMFGELTKAMQQQFAGLQLQLGEIKQRIDSIENRLTAVENTQTDLRPIGAGPVKTNTKPYNRPLTTEVIKVTGEGPVTKHGST
ncbi:uncharacterized protein LOC119405412 [Rhipicephalus sanguineus]|uniref:uncharacterized protein LOC119405412 n=1 Tax=Rhipicephalus sanguineus TaxID=34632 RepID=UPI0020C36BCA|nr:uncharacterized protein LOC119405412 [Rhipicephalus sanguineus]